MGFRFKSVLVLGTFLFSNSVLAKADFLTEKVSLALPDGHQIEALIRTPQQASEKKYPAFMIFGGFENAGEVLNLIQKDVPYVLATFDYPFQGLRQFQFPQTIYEAPKLKHAMQDTFEGVPALFQYLKGRSDIDASRIGIIGASFGSPFALMTAAREKDLSSLVLIHAFGDTRKVIENRLKQVFQAKNYYFAKQTAWFVSFVMQLYFQFPDVENAASSLNSNQHVLFIEAMDDEFIPKPVRTKLWEELNLSQADVDRVQLAGGHLQPGAFEMIHQLMNLVQGWAERIENYATH